MLLVLDKWTNEMDVMSCEEYAKLTEKYIKFGDRFTVLGITE